MPIELNITEDRWAELDLVSLTKAACDTCLVHLGLEPEACEISVLAGDDAAIANLNSEFRGKPQPTNVLSWPAQSLEPAEEGEAPTAPQSDPFGEIELGDIALAYETCAREAAEAGKPLADHVTHLIVHGLLHLLGYDHIRDVDATLMEGLEITILGKLGLDDPYTISTVGS